MLRQQKEEEAPEADETIDVSGAIKPKGVDEDEAAARIQAGFRGLRDRRKVSDLRFVT